VQIEPLTERAMRFQVAVPSWGVGTGGTRFARFPIDGEPRNVDEKIEDCGLLFRLVRCTAGISLHFPWDRPEGRPAELVSALRDCGLHVDSTNSNTFQDQPDQQRSYKFGSLTHTDPAVRRQAIDHNLECLELGQALGAGAHTVWIADGSNFAGQQHQRRALEHYLSSLGEVYAALPADCTLFLEHKLYEPAMYSTVISDWGTSYYCARELGPRAMSLVDLGHHAPNVNIEQIVARLIQFGKLGGFHFNDSKYGDDDLDAGSVKPFQLFLIFNELVDAEGVPGFAPRYMLDQSHNVTDPIESLALSACELVRAYVQASLVDREALSHYQETNDALMALQTLKQAFTCDVSPILAMARERLGGAIDPIATYRASGYRQHMARTRPAAVRREAGIV
jgi:L-rhamnose isomerase/sugar isomerase